MSAPTATDLFDLTGKVAIITGGAGGIGTVYSEALGAAGASVVLADLNGDAAAQAASALACDAMGVALDVTSRESAEAMAAAVTARFGGVDILVNNAAIMTDLPKFGLLDLPLDGWDLVMRVNVYGAIVCTRAVVGSMRTRGGGRIINGSSAGGFGNRGGIYGISKYALHSLTTNLAAELGPHGINVNSIAPGLVENESGFSALPPDSPMRAALASIIPGKKSAPPSDLVGTLLLLCSKAGDWINGQTISVDGGWVMRL